MQSGDSESAQRDLDRALRLAIASDHDDVAALAAARAMFARSELALQPLRALQDAPIAEAFAHSVDKEPRILAEFQNNLGVVQLNAGDLPAALATTTEALALKRRTFPADHPEIALTRSNLAFVELQNRRIDAAVAEFSGALRDAERSLGSGHPAVASIEYNLGHALRLHGRPKAASEHLERGLAIFTANLGEDATGAHFYTLELAAAALELRDAERAATLYARAERQILAGPGAASPFMATLRAGLGDLAAARGDLPRARAEYEDALALRSRIYGEHHPDLVHDHQAFGETLLAAGAPEAAVEHLRRALAVAERSLPFESPRIAETLEALGRAELRAGRAEAGLAALLRALRLREATLAPNSLEIGRSLLSLGEARLSQNESLEAAALLRRAEAILATGSAEDPELAAARFALARALAAAEPDAARSLARAALTGLRARGPAYAREADEVEAWLAGLAP
jgi:tetratricopeptide (TPR) repeat protein